LHTAKNSETENATFPVLHDTKRFEVTGKTVAEYNLNKSSSGTFLKENCQMM
jgi:hypothetical protein